jgi:hypothetical protein
MGFERIAISLQLTPEDRDAIQDPDLRRRYAGTQIKLPDPAWERDHPGECEYFKVARRGIRGEGLAWPRMAGVFTACSQYEAMEAGENLLALAGRRLFCFHQKGHEVKAGSKAGLPLYDYSQKWGDALIEYLKDKQVGLHDFASNWDHAMKYVWIDPKLYDDKKWTTVTQRLLAWAGPLGFMLTLRGLNPFLMRLFRFEGLSEREKIGRHVESVLSQAFHRPVRVKWDETVFQEERLAQQMAQFLVSQGMLDRESALEGGGYDAGAVLERKKKDVELMDEDPRLVQPLFNRGGQGAQGLPGNGAGRKTGTPDPPVT